MCLQVLLSGEKQNTATCSEHPVLLLRMDVCFSLTALCSPYLAKHVPHSACLPAIQLAYLFGAVLQQAAVTGAVALDPCTIHQWPRLLTAGCLSTSRHTVGVVVVVYSSNHVVIPIISVIVVFLASRWTAKGHPGSSSSSIPPGTLGETLMVVGTHPSDCGCCSMHHTHAAPYLPSAGCAVPPVSLCSAACSSGHVGTTCTSG
jgi:hypothetical protein